MTSVSKMHIDKQETKGRGKRTRQMSSYTAGKESPCCPPPPQPESVAAYMKSDDDGIWLPL